MFIMELMVEQVYRRIQFGLIILVVGASFVVWVMARPTCSECVPVRVLAVDDGKFISQCTVSWQRQHVTSGKDLPSFPGVVLFSLYHHFGKM